MCLQYCSVLRVRGLGNDTHVRNRCDRRQRLTPEAERENAIQICRFPNFAGRVPTNGNGKVVRNHAAAIVGHAHKGHATVLNFYRDTVGTRIDRIFHQLLDHRRRSVYDLARRDQIGYRKG